MGPTHEPGEEEFAAMWQALPAAEFPLLAEGLSSSRRTFEETFDFGMRAITRGLLAKAGTRHPLFSSIAKTGGRDPQP